MYLKNYHIHFIGVGGIGMSGIAKLLLELGYIISGSDIVASNSTRMLKGIGGKIYIGHKEDNIKHANLIVVSSAIEYSNIEIKAAILAKIPIIHRAKMLSELIRQKYSIAVSGTHGKTSTTSLIADLLIENNFDPTVLAGGILERIGSNALLGRGNFMVVEADESDGSLIEYSPTIAVVTNIDKDHLDFYQDINHIKKTFYNFIKKIPFYGTAILCSDDKRIQELIPKMKKKYITYGINSDADLRASKIVFNGMSSQFTINYLNKKKCTIALNLPGTHNIYNALSAIAVGLELNIPLDIIKHVMKKTKRVKRRMEAKGEIKGITILDDYGHHPTEIKATLMAAKKSWPYKRKIVVFQPHRYSRTKILFNEFINSFCYADILFILPIYSAGEKSIRNLKSENLCKSIKYNGHNNVIYVKSFKNCIEKLKNILIKNDLLITIGAGNVNIIGELILDHLSSN